MAYTLVNYDEGPGFIDLTMTFTTVNDESPWLFIPDHNTHAFFSSRSGATNYTVTFRGLHAKSQVALTSAITSLSSATEAAPSGSSAVASFRCWPYMQFRLTSNPTPQTVTLVLGFRR